MTDLAKLRSARPALSPAARALREAPSLGSFVFFVVTSLTTKHTKDHEVRAQGV